MKLEDHLGDILLKARKMTGVSPADSAAAAGLSEAELTELEKSGKITKRPNFAAVAAKLSLDAKKLEAFANGWAPAEKDLSSWRELRVITTSDDKVTVNCYLAWDEVQRDAALFDTGLDAKPILDLIASEGLTLRHIFLTHTHYDHIQALGAVREAWPKARVHTSAKTAPVDQRNKPAEIVHLGGLRVTYRETPGHTEDGTTYLIGNWQEDAAHVAIVGDTIFAASMGSGIQSWDIARAKIREQILTLPADTLLCPGHGPLTTVAEEQEHNPFF